MRVLNFDLSTTCIGAVAVDISDASGKISLMKSCPIVPGKFHPTGLGFEKTKKKVRASRNSKETISSWVRKGEEIVSASEKRRRDVAVREAQNLFLLTDLGASMGKLVDGVAPHIINVEQNAMFNGILTIELLAKLLGVLLGVAATRCIPVNQFKVVTVRARWDPAKLVREFSKRHSAEQLKAFPDVTKAALRAAAAEKYGQFGLCLRTDDESDACIVFDYWYEEIYLPGRKAQTKL